MNFNNLHGSAFYGTVFGWTMGDQPRGPGQPAGAYDRCRLTMWALPGYGDHLKGLNPRHARGDEAEGLYAEASPTMGGQRAEVG